MPLAVGVPLIVNVPPLNTPLTPAGNDPAVIDAPVPLPPILYVILVIALFIQTVWLSVPAAEDKLRIASLVTVIVPVSEVFTQGPVVPTVKLNVPLAVGVPLIVNVPPLNTPFTPAGNEPAVIDAPVPPPPIE